MGAPETRVPYERDGRVQMARRSGDHWTYHPALVRRSVHANYLSIPINKMFHLPAERPNEIVELRFERWLFRKRSLLAFKWRIAGSVARKIDRIAVPVDQKKVLILRNLTSHLHGMNSPKMQVRAVLVSCEIAQTRIRCPDAVRSRAYAPYRPPTRPDRPSSPARFMGPSGAGKL